MNTTKGRNVVVVGTQWGDEGKGKLVDWLTDRIAAYLSTDPAAIEGAFATLGERWGSVNSLINTIGPVWDGNEVWLLAAGGTLYFAFPLLYASSFSGFYLPLMMVLWLLMLRAIDSRNRLLPSR